MRGLLDAPGDTTTPNICVCAAELSSCADPVPVKLLPVAAHSEVVEHRLHVQLDLGLSAERLAVDPDIRLSVEVDQFRAQPDIERT